MSSNPTPLDPTIYGIDIDQDGRCQHYHTENDVAALLCQTCQQYFACYLCHDQLMTHQFVPTNPDEQSILCGVCRHTMDYQIYAKNRCPFCQHSFNPRCQLHHHIYFKA